MSTANKKSKNVLKKGLAKFQFNTTKSKKRRTPKGMVQMPLTSSDSEVVEEKQDVVKKDVKGHKSSKGKNVLEKCTEKKERGNINYLLHSNAFNIIKVN